MKHPNKLNDTNQHEYGINRHRKKIAALILAIIIYIFFMGPLIIDIVPQSWRFPLVFESGTRKKNERRASPAPVKYISPPQKNIPAQPTPQDQSIIVPPLPQDIPDKPLEKPSVQPKLVPKKRTAPESSETEPIAKLAGQKEQKLLEKLQPKPEPLKVEPTPEPPQKKEPRSEPIRDTPVSKPRVSDDSLEKHSKKHERKERRSMRKKWFKAESIAAYDKKQSQEHVENKQNAALSLSKGLYDHMYRENYHKGPQSLEGALGIGDPAGDFEINIFNEKFNRNFCNDSEMNPLYLHTGVPIQPHSIIFEISYTKDRKTKKVTFLQESYDKRLNRYVQEICLRMPLPQFPSRWLEDEITVRRTIDLTRPHPGTKVSFTAGQFWT